MTLDVELRGRFDSPFKYMLFGSIFSKSVHNDILEWLDGLNTWKLVETDFYEQYELHINSTKLPNRVAFLNERHFRSILASFLGDLFEVTLRPDFDLIAHKLAPGQKIGIHNDMRSGTESHRLTVQINRGLHDEDGGYFLLFNSEDPRDVHKILRPVTNSAIAFAISEQSHHAVSTQHSGTRFTLVFCLHERQSKTIAHCG